MYYFPLDVHNYGKRNFNVSWGDFMAAKKTKLKFHFHNPNTEEETAEYIAKIFVEVNQAKVERMLQEAVPKSEGKCSGELSHSA